MIEDMSVRGFSEKTRNDYIRNVRAFATFIRRSPATATAEDLRSFQLHQTQSGMQAPSINSAVSALRFFFTVTLDRPDLARRLTVVRLPRRQRSPVEPDEVPPDSDSEPADQNGQPQPRPLITLPTR
jgi:integrase/recombinase XerD